MSKPFLSNFWKLEQERVNFRYEAARIMANREQAEFACSFNVRSICDEAARMPRRGFRGGSRMLETRTDGISCLSSLHCTMITWEQKRNSRCNFADNSGFNCLSVHRKRETGGRTATKCALRLYNTLFETDNTGTIPVECLFLSDSHSHSKLGETMRCS